MRNTEPSKPITGAVFTPAPSPAAKPEAAAPKKATKAKKAAAPRKPKQAAAAAVEPEPIIAHAGDVYFRDANETVHTGQTPVPPEPE